MKIIYILFGIGYLAVSLGLNLSYEEILWDFKWPIFLLTTLLVSIFAGFGRVFLYHPRYRKGYLDWLKSTPWNGTKLPGGEILPDIRDGVFLVMTCAFFYSIDFTLGVIGPLLGFFVGYSLALLFTLPYKTWFIPLYIVPLIVYSSQFLHLWEIFAVAGISILLFSVLLMFMYLEDRRKGFFKKEDLNLVKGYISPVYPNLQNVPEVKTSTKLMLAFLVPVGLVTFLYLSLKKEPDILIVLCGFTLALFKWLSYIQLQYSTGFLYRIKKIILWDYDYDKILAVPIFIFTSALIISCVYQYIPLHEDVILFLAGSLFGLTTMFCGPKYRDWYLTGKVKLNKPSEAHLNKNDAIKEIKITH